MDEAHTARPKPLRVIVLDLDDTLYLERDFCRSGFIAAGLWLQERHNRPGLARIAMTLLDEGHRGNIFDLALPQVGLPPTPKLVQALVDIYRNHEPKISLAPDATSLLSAPIADCAFALLSDGSLHVQKRKIAALRLCEYSVHPVVCTDAFGRAFWKPHPRGYEYIERAFGLPGDRFVYVADNPAKDFVVPRARGWRSVQIRRAHQLHARLPPAKNGDADVVIESFEELLSALGATDDRQALI